MLVQHGDGQNELDGRAQVLHHADNRERQGLGRRRKEHERHNGDHAGGSQEPEVPGTLAEEGHLTLCVEDEERNNAEGSQD